MAAAVTVAAIVFLGKVFAPVGRGEPAAPAVPGRILYADASSEGLRPGSRCVRTAPPSAIWASKPPAPSWYPDRSGILITNDDAAGPAAPLRPAVVDPDGSNLRPLDATENPDLNLGCGDVSPDGTRIALEGFGQDGHPNSTGSTRSGLGRRWACPAARGHRHTSLVFPDGTRLSFFGTKQGVSPTGSGHCS